MSLYDVPLDVMSEDFARCWHAAGCHLQAQVDGGIPHWLRTHPHPPVLEHISFRLGNQLFFVRVVDADGRVEGPGNLDGLRMVARETRGHACLMPMRRQRGGQWQAALPGWGLINANSHQRVDPVALISEERIEMTDWELQDFAVQVVRDHLQARGLELMSWQSNPRVDPSLWFVSHRGERQWVVVRVARYPDPRPERPPHWQEIRERCAYVGRTGHFAPVLVRSAQQEELPPGSPPLPLWRGHGLHVVFDGVGVEQGDPG